MRDPYDILIASWQLALDADGHPKTTRDSYRSGMTNLVAYLRQLDDPPTPEEVTRTHIRAWMVDLRETHKQNTARTWLAGVRHFWKWALDEDEADHDPTKGVKMPPPGEVGTPVLTDEQIKAMLAAAMGRSFGQRRDRAIIRLFFDAGLRLAEMTSLTVDAVDVVQRMAFVEGKGARRSGPRRRAAPFGVKTAKALDGYLRARDKHSLAEQPALWLGERNRGALSPDGVEAVLKRRAAQAGIPHFHPHMARHTWASAARKAGLSEGDLMVLGGWRSRQMLDRYGAAEAAERAAAAYRSRSLGDRL